MSAHPLRHLGLHGASNFRDLGGYPSRDGRHVRWRQLFRSNHLGQLTEPDVAVLRELGVRTAFDFRGRNERAAGLCTIAEITVHSVPIEPSVVPALRALATRGQLTTDHALELMRESYRNYIRSYTPRFRALFQHVLNEDAPLVIHCTAGKDRTGVACALVLHALEVPDDAILEDYLLTNQLYRRETAAHPDLSADVVQTIGTVHASFLAAAFDAMRDDFGDVDTYLRDGLGIDGAARKTLQERYLTL
ncbi:tyrosine-protein phosphatase [Bradyrhizobium sp. SZCCHNRI1058]|uniref:tyrosine-protein phosphatase n=1 Tax=Bradyrhizobium sp. SZCCHNRI1058 TaxID=3057279 RepID=UPI002915E848|nr:tyrosine-protein phosphatase [Bradyrhizobium sp. SZCCHNRI1058]